MKFRHFLFVCLFAICLESQAVGQVVVAPLFYQPQVVPVYQPVRWQAYWVPQTGILGRTTWTVQWVAVPIQPPPQMPTKR